MDSWAELDNQLCYKKDFLNTVYVEEELKEYSALVVKMDKQMLHLRRQIKECKSKNKRPLAVAKKP